MHQRLLAIGERIAFCFNVNYTWLPTKVFIFIRRFSRKSLLKIIIQNHYKYHTPTKDVFLSELLKIEFSAANLGHENHKLLQMSEDFKIQSSIKNDFQRVAFLYFWRAKR